MKQLVIFSLFLFSLFGFVACEDENTTTFRHVENIDWDHGILNCGMIRYGDAHSGTMFARADSGQTFGPGYSYKIPDSLIGHAISISVDGWVRLGNLENNADVIVSCTSGDSVEFWGGCVVKDFVKNPNEWTSFHKDLSLSYTQAAVPNSYINVILHNIGATSFIDLDDLIINISEPIEEE